MTFKKGHKHSEEVKKKISKPIKDYHPNLKVKNTLKNLKEK